MVTPNNFHYLGAVLHIACTYTSVFVHVKNSDLRAVLKGIRRGSGDNVNDTRLHLFADLVSSEAQQLSVVLFRQRLIVDHGPAAVIEASIGSDYASHSVSA